MTGWLVIAYLWILVVVCKFFEISKKPNPIPEVVMAGYGVKEARLDVTRRPETTEFCTQCQDTGFVATSEGVRECPLCVETGVSEVIQ